MRAATAKLIYDCNHNVNLSNSSPPMPPLPSRQLRTDSAQATVINAAIKLIPKYGIEAVREFLLNTTDVPPEVIARVLDGGAKRPVR